MAKTNEEEAKRRSKARLEEKLAMEKERDAAIVKADELMRQLSTAHSQIRLAHGEPEALDAIDDVQQLQDIQRWMITGLTSTSERIARMRSGRQNDEHEDRNSEAVRGKREQIALEVLQVLQGLRM
jgi:hypothetical protein